LAISLNFLFFTACIDAIGLTGKDAGLIKAKQKVIDQHVDIGNVGDIIDINANFLHMLLDQYYLPIISPIGYDDHGRTYNINADDVASAVAVALDAEKLFLISDVEGLYRDFNDKESFISSITLEEGKALVDKGIIKGGMLPKLKSCINAVDQGVKAAHIIDGRLEHAVLLEIFTDSGVGTLLKGENYDTDENI
jgi:acetylglutamate kinase